VQNPCEEMLQKQERRVDLCNVGFSRFAIRAIMTKPGTYE
jgi:hypothetical protein